MSSRLVVVIAPVLLTVLLSACRKVAPLEDDTTRGNTPPSTDADPPASDEYGGDSDGTGTGTDGDTGTDTASDSDTDTDGGTDPRGDTDTGQDTDMVTPGPYPGPCEEWHQGEVVTTYRYDDLDQLSQTISGDPASPLSIAGYSYDASGNLLRYEEDTDADGRPDFAEEWTFNEKGKETSHMTDTDGDGIWDSIVERGFDEAGREILIRSDTDGDGVWDTTVERVFNDDGRVTLYQSDNDGDGLWNRIEEHIFNDEGDEILYRVDSDGDGTWDIIEEHTYDDSGNEILLRTDRDGDGVWDGIEEHAYNEAGRLILYRRNNDLDENWDVQDAYAYNEAGIIIYYSHEVFHGEGDPRNQIQESTYDDDGYLVQFRVDLGMDGEFDRTIEYVYDFEYDDEDRLVLVQGAGAEGAIEIMESYTYDADGRLIHREYQRAEPDSGGTHVSLKRHVWTFDDAGNLIEEEVVITEDYRYPEGDTLGDTTTSATFSRYNTAGTLIERTRSSSHVITGTTDSSSGSRTTTRWDDEKRVILETSRELFSDDGTLYAWTYDDFGNLIQYDVCDPGIWSCDDPDPECCAPTESYTYVYDCWEQRSITSS